MNVRASAIAGATVSVDISSKASVRLSSPSLLILTSVKVWCASKRANMSGNFENWIGC